ncbi:Ig-like domain-containing protein [uncultured Nitrosomonas sp.]|uniref:Ig-like domain-containing protein n=1 Tax=uncultured Nitrosomonas sp. TaxID=156424 RepID=UPI0025FE1D30|nr:Ig-like domain-containing protein [uncultured Nitrosomonas sp.]
MFNRNFIFIINTVAVLVGGFCATTVRAAPDLIGEWEQILPGLPFFPVHTNLLPTGKIMVWPGNGVSGNDPRTWDPEDHSVVALSKPGYDLFCVGHTFLADGTLFVAGGHVSNFVGLSRTSTYNYLTDTWSSFPDMNAGRWYPTTTALANGDVLTISGDIDTIVGVNPLPQVFQVSTGTWRDLTSAQLQVDDYPRMFLSPNGKLFNAGPSATTRYLDTSGTGAWSFVATRGSGYSDYGSAVMYAPGKILVMGGGQQPPKKTAEVIDLNEASPTWRVVGSMQYGRRHLNATLLPDGTVLVTGGTSSPGFNDTTGHVDAAELWDPVTEQWTTLASSAGIPRGYHSTALLLPDGRIFSTGGDFQPEIEIYSPPYLFKGARPTITSAPSSITYGDSFSVDTPDAATISKVTMLKIASVTHAFNQSQVISDLSFSQTAGGLSITAPPNPNVASPGYYMLFILNGSGVPSVAKFVNIGPGPKPTVSISAPANGSTVAGSVTLSANASDDIGVSGVQFKLDGTNIGAEDTTSPYTITMDSTAVADGPHTITAVARDADGNTTTSPGVDITVNNANPLPDVIVTQLSYVNGIFTSTVKNQGTAATPAGVAVGVGYSVDGKYKTWGAVNGPMAAGASVIIGTNGTPYTIPDGTHTMTAYVDDAERFAELDETNNQISMPVTGGITDIIAPTVSITIPIEGITVSGSSVTLSASASDNVGVSGVQFLVSGDYPLAEITTAPYTVTWNSMAVADGPHTVTAVARDAAGNTATSPGVGITVSNATPFPDVIVTQLSYANGIFTSTVKNQGTAATPAGVVVGMSYLVDGKYKTWGAINGPLAAGASATISTNGAPYTIPDGTHTMTAYVDDLNRFMESNETNNQFSVPIAVGGTSPTVSITTPTEGTTVSGSFITLSANAADDIGVSGVQFKLDGTNIGAEDTTSPYTITMDSTTVADGPHTITAVARDADGNTTTSPGVGITVSNATPFPDVIVTQLSYANGIFTSTVKNQGTAATPAGVVVGMSYLVDGKYKTWGAINGPLAAGASATISTNGAPYTIPDGTHTMTAYVDDLNRFMESNETNNQFSVPIAVGGTSPTVSITTPTEGTTVSGSFITLSANAADDIGVSGVQFKLDGTNIGAEDTTSPYTITMDSTTVADGPHTITAVARDADGNTTTSPGVGITVSNATPFPDVIVTQLSYANGIFTSTVKNQGTAATPAGVVVGMSYLVDGKYKTWGAINGPLAAGASATISTNGAPYTIPDGTHTMTAYVDDLNRFMESNETNNGFSQLVTAP